MADSNIYNRSLSLADPNAISAGIADAMRLMSLNVQATQLSRSLANDSHEHGLNLAREARAGRVEKRQAESHDLGMAAKQFDLITKGLPPGSIGVDDPALSAAGREIFQYNRDVTEQENALKLRSTALSDTSKKLALLAQGVPPETINVTDPSLIARGRELFDMKRKQLELTTKNTESLIAARTGTGSATGGSAASDGALGLTEMFGLSPQAAAPQTAGVEDMNLAVPGETSTPTGSVSVPDNFALGPIGRQPQQAATPGPPPILTQLSKLTDLDSVTDTMAIKARSAQLAETISTIQSKAKLAGRPLDTEGNQLLSAMQNSLAELKAREVEAEGRDALREEVENLQLEVAELEGDIDPVSGQPKNAAKLALLQARLVAKAAQLNPNEVDATNNQLKALGDTFGKLFGGSSSAPAPSSPALPPSSASAPSQPLVAPSVPKPVTDVSTANSAVDDALKALRGN